MEEDLWPRERPLRTRSDPPICMSVHGAYHALMRRLHAVTRDFGLDPSEALVLVRLLRDQGVAPAVLRHALGFHRSTLSSILDRLERSGLIRRRRSAFDGRRLEITLTTPGTIAAEQATEVVRDLEEELAMFTSPAQRRAAAIVFEAAVAVSRPDGVLDI